MPKNIEKSNKEENKGFLSAFEIVIADLPKRSQDITRSRFGIGTQKPLTLEEIGRKYSITRERVRQVIREVCRKVSQKKEGEEIKRLIEKIDFVLISSNGIMGKENILEALGGKNAKEKGAAKFFLQCVGEFEELEEKDEMIPSICRKSFSLDKWKKFIDAAKSVLKNAKEPLEEKNFFALIMGVKEFSEFTKEKILNLLSVSEQIKKNKFSKWGLSEWREVNPKGTREKAFLVIKEEGKPMHFRDIAKKIDEHGLNKKKTHPQTVHNELIKDSEFILVGRGIYALASWGYSKGTVKDVIEKIIKENGKKLTKEEVIAQVLKVRQVKKTTIVINLNNHFKKDKDGRYSI